MLNLRQTKYIKGAVFPEDYPENDGVEFVLLGRSNVGKSTFINSICDNSKVAKTSSKPGKTQVLNFFDVSEGIMLVDVPGYGYAKVSKVQRAQFGEMIETYLTTRDSLSFVVLLVDFKVGPTEDDLLMYNFLKHIQKKVLIVATKKDKIKNSMHHKQTNLIIEKLQLHETDKFISYAANNNKLIQNAIEEIDIFLQRD